MTGTYPDLDKHRLHTVLWYSTPACMSDRLSSDSQSSMVLVVQGLLREGCGMPYRADVPGEALHRPPVSQCIPSAID